MSFTRADYPPLSTIGYVSTVSVATFSPSSITGCQLWLDGSDSTTITLTGSNITTWNDKSGSANHMNTLAPSSGTGLWPTVGTPINGRSTVKFLSLTGISQSTTLNGVKNLFWIGRIAAPDNTGGGQFYFLLGHDSSYEWCGDSYGSTFMNTTYAQAGIYNASPTSLFTSDVRATTNATFSSVYLPTSPSVSLLSVAGITGSTAYQGLCYDRTAHNGWCGDLAEVIIYSTALTVSQRQQVEGYLAWKWGLQATLPGSHPYASTIPNAGFTSTLTSSLIYNLAGYTQSISTLLTSTSFSPSSITGCQIWLDGADPAGTGVKPANNATVSTWVDKSGSNNSGTGVNTPTYSLTSNAINFSSGPYFTLPNGAMPYGNSAYSIFIVPSFSSTSGGFGMIAGGSMGSQNQVCAFRTDNSTLVNYWWGNDLVSSNITFTANTQCIASCFYAPGVNRNIYVNGILLGQDIPGAARNQTNTGNMVGKTYNTEYMSGTIAEVIVYNVRLTSTQQQQVEGYLAWKWGLQASLSNGHPYASINPNATTSSLVTVYTAKTLSPFTTLPYYTAFTPRSISTLALWIDGSDPLGTGVAPTQGTLISSLKDKSINAYPISTFSTTVGFPSYKTAANGNLGALQLAAGNGIFLSSIALTPYMTLYAVYSPILPSTGIAIEQGAGFLLTSVSSYSTMYTIGGGTTISATGGTITTSGLYKIHTFTTTGATTFTLTSPASITAQVLVVGGGGAGGSAYVGGGGGAGGAVFNASFTITSGTYTVTVGAGGARTSAGVGYVGPSGSNSSFSSITGTGGGGGGSYLGVAATNGGCGGGGPFNSGQFGTGSQGGNGAPCGTDGNGGYNCGGGGGGMGGTAPTPSGVRPSGGAGATYTVAGTAYTLAGGGGAGSDGLGGLGQAGGGLGGNGNNAGQTASSGTDATANTGSGGGGGGGTIGSLYGGAGGSGIVIIAYPLSAPVSTTLIASGLLYNFDATLNLPSTSTWTDLIGTGNLTLYNTPTVVSGSISYVRFNGTTQYGASVNMTNLTAFTITMWIRTSSTTNNSTFYLKPHLIGEGSPGGGSRDFGLTIGGGYAGIWTGIGSGDAQNQSETNTSAANYIANGAWHELTVTSSYTNGTLLYVDGTQFGSALAASQATESGQNWYIAATNYLAGGPNCWAAVDISLIALYNRQLSAAEVSANFTAKRTLFGV